MEVKWPNKWEKHTTGCQYQTGTDGCTCGFFRRNDTIDACINAFAKAQKEQGDRELPSKKSIKDVLIHTLANTPTEQRILNGVRQTYLDDILMDASAQAIHDLYEKGTERK